MADSSQKAVPESQDSQDDVADLAGGNYEVIRQRLTAGGGALRTKTNELNERRKEVFGGSELTVTANERVRTENNCVPRDIVSIQGNLLLGYNVFMGLKSETDISDVLALHSFKPGATPDEGFDCAALDVAEHAPYLVEEQFQSDFQTLYRYFRDAKLLQLIKSDTRLLAVFQIGAAHTDTKVFRWRIDGDGSVSYMDDRGAEDFIFPPRYDFEWKVTGRDDQVGGEHPHFNIDNTLFVETIGGDLTVKIEDNTTTGEGIYSEPVDDHNQTLDDASIRWARLGSLLVLEVQPFREPDKRYLVYSDRTHKVVRLDGIGQACVQLPEDHGIIFPGGYFLQTGEHKVFEGEVEELEFKRMLRSPNGEDVLYVFHRRRDGHYSLFPYNLIRKEIQSPILCHGYSLFADGRLVVFRSVSEEPTRVHPMQVWQTPFTSAEYAASAPTDGSFLANVGNADLVRGISEAFTVCRLIANDEPTRATFEDIIATCTRAANSYYWLSHADVDDLKGDLDGIRRTAELIIDEFEKVQIFRQQAAAALAETEDQVTALDRDLRSEVWHEVAPFLDGLTRLRTQRGHIITLREMRYIDRPRLDELEAAVVEHFDRVSRDCVRFLLRDEAFGPLAEKLDQILAKLNEITKVADIRPLEESVVTTSQALDLLSDVVANLQIDDATQRTTILESISEIFAHANRVRATIEGKRRGLQAQEGRAEFGAQFKLLGQSVSSALAMCDTPEKCDEELARVMIQLEELEGRFSEFDEFLGDLAAKREEIYDAFSGRKQTLLDERQRRAQNIIKAADRILEGVGRRVRSLKSVDEVNGYFASDGMIMKLRQLAEQLIGLGDTVKADELQARLKTARQNSLRSLRDKLELFAGDGNSIKLGRHFFSVNTQRLELSMVQRDDEMAFHLGGTDFYETVDDSGFQETSVYWSQDLVSETEDVYRGEYLAACILFDGEAGRSGLSMDVLHDDARTENGVLKRVRTYAQDRYDEGYERGLHDSDAALILEKLLAMRDSAGLLRFAAMPRSLAVLFWVWSEADTDRRKRGKQWQRRAQNLGRLRRAFADSQAVRALADELGREIAFFCADQRIERVLDIGASDAAIAGSYLVEELMETSPRFVIAQAADRLREALLQDMDLHSVRRAFEDDLHELDKADDMASALELCIAWADGFVNSRKDRRAGAHHVIEAAVSMVAGALDREVSSALTEMQVKGLLGRHPRVQDQTLDLRIDEFMARLRDFIERRVLGYRNYRKLRSDVLTREKASLRLDELMPKVMSAFVRNKLINDVYLHLIGDNLAKQIGASGAQKRTDLMGMLLLISPPGYGKTTLMEYISNRLGLVFVKVNGPSLGHSVTSLDPSEAPNATARQEVEKINLAFEMSNNVMLYCDDIQHTHPEFLQKFISLCDAQRRIEGVWKGRTRTYDMRGKKFCVVMAGNPYTESGESFQIPDMLSNRADVYNLGDILGGKEELFALSYIENALTSNSTLAPLATREQADVYKLVRMARGEEIQATELSHGYSAVELNDILAVLRHMFQCQRVLLAVNQKYIESAAQDDRFRTEPPFKLQGSYRNMNKLAEKLVPAMTAEEVERLIDDHYTGEAQTLTTEAEQNLLELARLRGRMSEAQQARFEEIRAEYVRLKRMGGGDDDPVTRVTGTLTGLSEELSGIRSALTGSERTERALDGLRGELAGVRQSLDKAAEEAAKLAAAEYEEVDEGESAPESESSQALERLRSELAGIRQALFATASQRSSQPAQPAMDPNMASVLDRLELALKAVVRPLRVEVQTPPAMEELLAQQVAIVERTLVPLVRTATQHMHDSQIFGQKLLEVTALLEQVDARLRGR